MQGGRLLSIGSFQKENPNSTYTLDFLNLQWSAFLGIKDRQSSHTSEAVNVHHLPSGDKGNLLFRAMVLTVKKNGLVFQEEEDWQEKKILYKSSRKFLELRSILIGGVGNICQKKRCQKRNTLSLTQWWGWCCGQSGPGQTDTRCLISQPPCPRIEWKHNHEHPTTCDKRAWWQNCRTRRECLLLPTRTFYSAKK